MATWVRNGTGTLPSNTDGHLTGTIELDNGTVPGDWDGTAVNSVRIQYRTEIGSGSFTAPEDHTVLRTVELTYNGVGTAIASISGTPVDLDAGSDPVDTDETDSTIGTGHSNAQWEGAELNPTDVAAVRNWTTYNQDMGKDGVLVQVASTGLVVTVTIDYTPDAGVNIDGDGIGHGVSSGITAHDVVVNADSVGHGTPSGLTAHDVVVNSTGVGHGVSSGSAAVGIVRTGGGIGHAVATGLAESPQPFEVNLAAITDPGDDSNHILQVQMRVASGTGTMVVQLKQGNTVIQEFNQALTTSFVEYDFDVTSASSITDYSTLRVRGWIQSGNTDRPEVSRIRLCMPSIPPAGGVVTGTGDGHGVSSGLAVADVRIDAVASGHGVSSSTLKAGVVRDATANGRSGIFGGALAIAVVVAAAEGHGVSSGQAVGVPTRILTGAGHGVTSSTVTADVLVPAVAVGHGVPTSTVTAVIAGAIAVDAIGHAVPSATATNDAVITATAIGRSGVFGSSVGVPTRILTASGRAVTSSQVQADVIVNGTGVGHAAPSSQAVPGIIKVAVAQGHATAQGISDSDVLVVSTALGHAVPSGQAIGALGEFVLATASGHATARGSSVTDMVVVATASDTAAPSATAESTSLIVGAGAGQAVPSSLSVGLVSQLITASAVGHAVPRGELTQPVVVVNATASDTAAPSAQAQLVRVVVGTALGQIVTSAGSDSNVLLKAVALGNAVSWGQVSPEGETILLTAIGHVAGWAKAIELTQVITGVIGGLRDPDDNVTRTREMNQRTLVGATRGAAKRIRTPETTTRDPDTL